MSSIVLLPVFFLLNGLGTHQLLQQYIPSYKTLPYKIQQETLGRWNSFLTQLFLIGGYVFATTEEQHVFIRDIFGIYFISDMIHMSFYNYDVLYYIHHCIPLLIFYLGQYYFTPPEIHTLYLSGILLELTSPPISVVWFLSKVGLKPKGYLLLKMFAYLNFLAVRIVYFPYYWYMYLAFLPKLIMAPFHLMNVYWFYSMTGYVVKTLNDE